MSCHSTVVAGYTTAVQRIVAKLGLHSRTEAVAVAYREGPMEGPHQVRET